MDAKLKECPHCGSPARLLDHRTIFSVECTSAACAALVLGNRAPEPNGEMGGAYWAEYQQTAIDRWNARAIAQPVAGGSVDTEEFKELVCMYGNWRVDSDYDAIIDKITSWGAQQWHEGFQEGISQLQQERDNLLKLAASRREWAEKAEAESAHKQSIIDRLMLEYCPDEMTAEQMAEWAKHQVRAE